MNGSFHAANALQSLFFLLGRTGRQNDSIEGRKWRALPVNSPSLLRKCPSSGLFGETERKRNMSKHFGSTFHNIQALPCPPFFQHAKGSAYQQGRPFSL